MAPPAVPTVTEEKLQTFMSNWQAAGCPGGRLLALPMLSTVMPQNPGVSGRNGSDQGQGFGPEGTGFTTSSNAAPQGFGSLTFAEDDAAAEDRDRDLSRGSGLSSRSNNKSDRAQGSVSESEVDTSVTRLGPWAVEALKPGGPGDKQPLLRQVVGDIASGRHPVTQ
jgi:hypothetical protein